MNVVLFIFMALPKDIQKLPLYKKRMSERMMGNTNGLRRHNDGLTPQQRKRLSNKRLRIRFIVFSRDNFTCRYCGRKPPETILEVDHYHPKSAGGTNRVENFITSCRECNRGKGDFILNKVESP
jgi:5-methylcytosine-specific restriction endonuclease McrA